MVDVDEVKKQRLFGDGGGLIPDGKKHTKVSVVTLVAFGACGVMVILAVVLSIVVANKYQFVDKSNRVVSYKVVCTDSTIDEYNNLAFTSSSVVDIEKFSDKIVAMDGYAGDPNCVMVALLGYIKNANLTKAKPQAEVFKNLVKDGLYPSPAIQDMQSLQSLDNMLTRLQAFVDMQTE